MLIIHGKEIDDQEALEYHTCVQLAGIIAGAFYSGKYNWIGAEKDLKQITLKVTYLT